MKDYSDLVKLIDKVNATKGIDTSIEAVCEYQDMIGHSTEEQLTELANDKNRRRSFYWVYSLAYRVEDLLNFFIKHDESIFNLKQAKDELEADKDELTEKLRETKEDLSKTRNDLQLIDIKCKQAEHEVIELKAEIIELKAKLYDLIK